MKYTNMTRDQIIERFLPVKFNITRKSNITLKASGDREDGTCDVTVILNGEEIDQFVSSQSEMKVLALAISGLSVPKRMLQDAETSKSKREKACTP